jgi:hypothetical protein
VEADSARMIEARSVARSEVFVSVRDVRIMHFDRAVD